MRGILLKTLYETWLVTLIFSCALFVFNLLLAFIAPQIEQGIGQVLTALPFVRQIIQAMLGIELGDSIGPQIMYSLAYVHPVILTIVWGQEIVFCTRVPAGEIDRGTIDILLALPVSRRRIFLAETTAWLLSGVMLLLFGFLGQISGTMIVAGQVPSLDRVVIVLVNLACVYLAVGGLAWLASAICNRRGWAAGSVAAVVLSSFLLNFLAQFWEPAKRVMFLGIMNYYRPAQIFMDGKVPAHHLLVLLAIFGVSWTIAGEWFARRAIAG